MNIIKLYALKLYLEKLEKKYIQQLTTTDIEVYGDYYQKLKEIRQHLWQIEQALTNLRTCEKKSHSFIKMLITRFITWASIGIRPMTSKPAFYKEEK